MVDEPTAAKAEIALRLREQAEWCSRLGSPLYGGLLTAAAADVEAGGPCWTVLAGHQVDRRGSALPLRFMGAVHRLVLEGRAPDLARYYPTVGGDPGAPGAWTAFRATVEAEHTVLRALVERGVQTNEVRRSAVLLGGFLLVARDDRSSPSPARDRRQRRPEPALGPLPLRERVRGVGQSRLTGATHRRLRRG